MNYNAILWFSGFLAGCGVGIIGAAIGVRLLPLRIKHDTLVVEFRDADDAESEKWRQTE